MIRKTSVSKIVNRIKENKVTLIVIVTIIVFFILLDNIRLTNYKESCDIKGNIGYTNGKKIYHLPDCPSYDRTKINKSYGERRFCSEEEAINAGRRKAENCDY